MAKENGLKGRLIPAALTLLIGIIMFGLGAWRDDNKEYEKNIETKLDKKLDVTKFEDHRIQCDKKLTELDQKLDEKADRHDIERMDENILILHGDVKEILKILNDK